MQRPVCWFMKWSFHFNLVRFSNEDLKHLKLSRIILFYNECIAKCYNLYVTVVMRYIVQMTIYWCVTKNESG